MTFTIKGHQIFTELGVELTETTKDGKSFIVPKNDEGIQFLAVSKVAKAKDGDTITVNKVHHDWIGNGTRNPSASNPTSQKSLLDQLTELTNYLDNEDERKTFAALYTKANQARSKSQEIEKAKSAYEAALAALKELGITMDGGNK